MPLERSRWSRELGNHTEFVPSTYWYLPHWTFVRIEFMKSTEYDVCHHSEHTDSETDDLGWLSALPLVNCIDIGRLLALNLRSLPVK